jgi:hypothetical protein
MLNNISDNQNEGKDVYAKNSIVRNQLLAIKMISEEIFKYDTSKNLSSDNEIYLKIDYIVNNIDDIIEKNSYKIKKLLFQLSCLNHDYAKFKVVNKICLTEHSKHIMFPNLRFDSTFLRLLGLRDLVQLGTWGRYKVKIKENVKKDNNKNEKFFVIIHCNIHNNDKRKCNLKYAIDKYISMFKKFNVINYFVYSANQFVSSDDVKYAHNIHKRHAHWSPYSTAKFCYEIYKRFPNSIILTHPYIASLLIDNGMDFNYDYSLSIDDKKSVVKSFSNILNWLKNNH